MDYKQIKDMAMQADLVPSEVVLKLLEENARYREALEFLKREYNGLVWRVAEKALKGE